jgi:CxxC motif-containing protein (DUF1111 family)
MLSLVMTLGLGAGAIALAGGATAVDTGGVSIRQQLITAPIDARLGGDTTVPDATDLAYTLEAPNAPPEQQRLFAFGNRVFGMAWAIFPGPLQSFDGLGPTFNQTSCGGCHARDGAGEPPLGPGDPMTSMLVRLSAADGSPPPAYGDQLEDKALDGVPPEGRATIAYRDVHGTYGDGTPYTLLQPNVALTDLAFGPIDGARLSARVAPPVFGLGLLEAVPTATLQALADPDDANHDGISGRINWLTDAAGSQVAGRFGWKANVATLPEQSANAANGDLGITTTMRPQQNCPSVQVACATTRQDSDPEMSDSFFDRLVVYVRTLAVPAARGLDRPLVQKGEQEFRDFGCAECHVPTLRTGADAALPELANQTIHPFTDLLIHDMGPGLADNRPDGSATGTEWRTPPLWGLGLLPLVNGHDRLLHDGRARGAAEAILWHGGEATAAEEAFRNASASQRAALLAFLASL